MYMCMYVLSRAIGGLAVTSTSFKKQNLFRWGFRPGSEYDTSGLPYVSLTQHNARIEDHKYFTLTFVELHRPRVTCLQHTLNRPSEED